jgi:hypothetical protein
MTRFDEYKYKISDVEHEQNHMEELSKNTRDCKHGHLARKCEMCENEKLESSLSAAVKALSRFANRENWEKSHDSGKRDWWLATTHGYELATKFFAEHPELRGK